MTDPATALVSIGFLHPEHYADAQPPLEAVPS